MRNKTNFNSDTKRDFNSYDRDFYTNPRLNNEKENYYFSILKTNPKARYILNQQYVFYVASIASQIYQNYLSRNCKNVTIEYLDLFQEGMLCLNAYLDKYDYISHDNTFTTFITKRLYNCINTFKNKKLYSCHVTDEREIFKCLKKYNQLMNKLNGLEDKEEQKEVKKKINTFKLDNFDIFSVLQESLPFEDNKLNEIVAEDNTEENLLEITLKNCFENKLSPMEQKVIGHEFGIFGYEKKTTKEIISLLNIKRNKYYNLKKKGLQKFKSFLKRI